MPLPILHLTGSPFEQGFTHGRELRERILFNLGRYFNRFEKEGGLSREAALERARQYVPVIEAASPAYLEGIRGIAQGAEVEFDAIAALNARYEILYSQYSQNALLKGQPEELECTSYAVLPEATENGHLLMGQNWDWFDVQGAVLHTQDEEGLETLGFTEAGIYAAKLGLNSAGLGLALNGLLSTSDDWSRLGIPYHVRAYNILRSRDFETALRAVEGTRRSCSTNFLLAQVPDQVVDIEAAPDETRHLGALRGCLTHANHFVDPGALGIEEPPNPRRYYSYHRQDRLRELLEAGQPVSVAGIQEALRDHQDYPNGLCRHPDPELPDYQRSITVTAVVMDLHTREMWLTDRQPCSNPFEYAALQG